MANEPKKEKPPIREQDLRIKQMTFRISEFLYEETRAEADSIGSSHNSFLLMLVSMGLRAYRGTYVIQQKEK